MQGIERCGWKNTEKGLSVYMKYSAIALWILSVSTAQAETLQALIIESLSQHPALLAQRASLESSSSGVEIAKWQYFPTPSLSVEGVSAAKKDYSYQGDERVTTLRIQQPVWTGGKIGAGVEKAEASMSQAKASEKEVRKQLSLKLIQAFSDWVSADLRLKVVNQSYKIHENLEKQLRRRVELGASAESDRSVVSVRLTSLSAEAAMIKGQINSAKSKISLALGREIQNTELEAVSSSPYPIYDSVSAIQQLAVMNSPTLERLQAQEKIISATVAEKTAELWPQVYLRIERQFGNYSIPHADPSTRTFIGFSSSLNPGLLNKAAINGALAQREAAREEINAHKLLVQEEVVNDSLQLSMLTERLNAIRSSIIISENILDSYTRQFLAGRKSWIEVMNAARETAQYQSQGSEIEAAQTLLSWRLAVNTYGLPAVLLGEK